MKAQAIQEVTFDFAKLNQKDPVAKMRLSRKSIDQRRVSTIHKTQTATLKAVEGAGDGEVTDNATFEYYVENVLPQVQSLRFPDTTDDMLEDLQAKSKRWPPGTHPVARDLASLSSPSSTWERTAFASMT